MRTTDSRLTCAGSTLHAHKAGYSRNSPTRHGATAPSAKAHTSHHKLDAAPFAQAERSLELLQKRVHHTAR